MVNGTPSRKSALLCPGCRRLVSVDEPKCPYCGLPAPGSRWKNTVFTRGFSSGEQLINTIIAVNAVMYLLSLLMSNRGLNLSGNPMSFLSPDNQGLLLLGATGAIPHRSPPSLVDIDIRVLSARRASSYRFQHAGPSPDFPSGNSRIR